MKTCTNGLGCPTVFQCGSGCFFNEADTNSNYFRAMHAAIHTGNGGNVITDGAALKPLYDGDDVIAQPLASRVRLGLMVCGLLWLVALAVLIYRLF